MKSQHSTTEDDPVNGSSRYEEKIKELENKQKLLSHQLQEVENKIREVEASIKSECRVFFFIEFTFAFVWQFQLFPLERRLYFFWEIC